MKKLIIALTSMIVLASTGIGYTQEKSALETNKAKLLITLPTEYNTPDGAALDIDGNIILSIPNFNNNRLIET